MLRLLTKKLKSQSLNEIKPDEQMSPNSGIISSTSSDHFENEDTLLSFEVSSQKHEEEEDVMLGRSTEERAPGNVTCDNKENMEFRKENNHSTIRTIVNNNNDTHTDRNFELTSEDYRVSSHVIANNSASFPPCNHDINLVKMPAGEKRKFSRTSLCQYKCSRILPVPTYHGDSSSDEEIKELYSKHKCNNYKGSVITTNLHGGRKIVCINNKVESPRPSLNFDKMHQTGKKFLKKPRPRVVKLKAIHSLKSSKELTDFVTFKPINLLAPGGLSTPSTSKIGCSTSILVPVEDPFQSGYVF